MQSLQHQTYHQLHFKIHRFVSGAASGTGRHFLSVAYQWMVQTNDIRSRTGRGFLYHLHTSDLCALRDSHKQTID